MMRGDMGMLTICERISPLGMLGRVPSVWQRSRRRLLPRSCCSSWPTISAWWSRQPSRALGTMYHIQAGSTNDTSITQRPNFANAGYLRPKLLPSTRISSEASKARSQHSPTKRPKPSITRRKARSCCKGSWLALRNLRRNSRNRRAASMAYVATSHRTPSGSSVVTGECCAQLKTVVLPESCIVDVADCPGVVGHAGVGGNAKGVQERR
mmetsp:Transcript_125729/g.250910  ORF Transcript_125729/g.250910 Transcript_125729/m.250910 type:complete len:210 (+) Transcript_125729:78-707(+)